MSTTTSRCATHLGPLVDPDGDAPLALCRAAACLRLICFPCPQTIRKRCRSLPYAEAGIGHLDGDTAISAESWEAALKAAGATIAAIDNVVSGKHRNAFCAVRPPGKHSPPRPL
jgi:acetoin utilization deacetylase AcuC-like enzyme